MSEKPKKELSEERLRQLADMRKKANEVRKQKAELKRAEKAEKEQQFKKAYEEKVLKKKQPPPVPEPVEETDKEIYNRPEDPEITEADSDGESVNTPLPKASKKKVVKSQAQFEPVQQEPNYKQMYYQHKLAMLQQQQEQMSFAS
jgi:hypothetical protein